MGLDPDPDPVKWIIAVGMVTLDAHLTTGPHTVEAAVVGTRIEAMAAQEV